MLKFLDLVSSSRIQVEKDVGRLRREKLARGGRRTVNRINDQMGGRTGWVNCDDMGRGRVTRKAEKFEQVTSERCGKKARIPSQASNDVVASSERLQKRLV